MYIAFGNFIHIVSTEEPYYDKMSLCHVNLDYKR